jgi:anti-sigma factor RsiW
MLADKETRDIQAYLRGTLPRSRREAFERRLQDEPALRQRMDELTPLLDGLDRMALEDRIQAIIEKGADQVTDEADRNPSTCPEKRSSF